MKMIVGKYKNSDYGIGFDSPSEFSLPNGTTGKSVIIFGADMNSSDIMVIREKIS